LCFSDLFARWGMWTYIVFIANLKCWDDLNDNNPSQSHVTHTMHTPVLPTFTERCFVWNIRMRCGHDGLLQDNCRFPFLQPEMFKVTRFDLIRYIALVTTAFWPLLQVFNTWNCKPKVVTNDVLPLEYGISILQSRERSLAYPLDRFRGVIDKLSSGRTEEVDTRFWR
jgi:hypothetical protein